MHVGSKNDRSREGVVFSIVGCSRRYQLEL